MAELPLDAPPVTVADMVRCVNREVRLREKVYPVLVESGKMSQGKADREVQAMQETMNYLQKAAKAGVTP